jgi:tRNA(Arg) A34 adenosine deaminase TadA
MTDQIISKLQSIALESLASDPHKPFHTIAAVINKWGHILSIGENSYIKTHPVQKRFAIIAGKPNSQYLHAEIAALVKSSGYGLVVLRISKRGELVLSKPCPICMLAIKEAKIDRVWYSNDSGLITEYPYTY